MGRRRLLTKSHPPAGGDTGTSGSVADKIEDVKSTNGDTRKGGATIVCRRQVSAAGDSRPSWKLIQAFGCRIRVAKDKEAELRKCIADERSKRTEWTDKQWRVKMNAIAAERRWGVGQHGGNRKGDADAKPAAGGDDSADVVWKMQPDGKRKGDAENAVAEPAAGGDDSADEVRKMQPDVKRKRSPSGGNNAHVAALAPPLGADKSSLATGSATLSLAAGSASGGIRLCSGVNMGYRLIGPPLGAGTFGTTYHAVWKNGDTDAGGQHVVVKHIPLARPDKSLLKEEAREVEILSMLHHNNVVKLLFAVQTPFALDLLLEVCDADLRYVLRRWDMTEAESKDAIRQICHGLEYIHDRNVVHRDVKPANILMQKVRGHSIYKLGDFGSARQMLHCKSVATGTEKSESPESPMTLQITTLWYRAPEICLRCHDYGTPVDMWAFGCVCMEILSKKVAFQGTSDLNMLCLIFRKFGLPNKTRWQDLYKITRAELIERLYAEMPASGGTSWTLEGIAREFVGQLLVPSPSQRLAAVSAKAHAFIAQ